MISQVKINGTLYPYLGGVAGKIGIIKYDDNGTEKEAPLSKVEEVITQ